MNRYTLHVRDDSRWHVVDRFADRDSAMVIANRLRNTGECSGIKILEGTVDPATKKGKDNIVFAWTTRSKEDEAEESTNEYMDRRKKSRIRKKKQEELKRKERAEGIKKALITAAIVCVFLGGVYALYLLKNS